MSAAAAVPLPVNSTPVADLSADFPEDALWVSKESSRFGALSAASMRWLAADAAAD
eukprot:gene36156-48449_t